MKKILFLLLLITSVSYGQGLMPTKLKITNNAISTTAPFIAAQETDGFVNKINKSDLIEVIEITSAINLPVTGVTGKIYVTLDNNRLYRWTGTIYQDLGYVDVSNKVDKVTGKSLISDAEITRLATLANYTHPVSHPPSIITQDASNRFVTDSEKTAWNAKQTALGFTAENTTNKNIANGYAGLGADGKLISSQLPSITISDTYVVASQVAMLGLSGAEKGDVAVRTDLNKSFILKGNSYSTLADWQELLTPTSAVTTVFGRNGAVTAQTGDYNADQITETATRKFQTANQKTFNDATSSIQTQLNGKQASGSYEPSFSKNTAFNKNFGTTAGTVVEGGTLGSNAYTSTSYFQLNTNFGGDTNQSSLNIAGKLFNATNAQEPYGSFISFGQNAYTTQINSSPLKNGNTYIRVSGDAGGIGDWRTLWHSGNFNPANYLPLTGGILSVGNNEGLTVRSFNSGFVEIGKTGGSRWRWQNDYSAGNQIELLYGNNVTPNDPKITITSTGNLSIPGTITANGGFFNSDRRLKTILKRDGDVAYFKWKDGRDSKTHIGYIAQEVRKTNPDQVQKGEDKMLSVNYVEILVEKVRMLEKRIEELEKK